MQMDGLNRRSFLKTMSSAGMLAALPEAAFGGAHVVHEIAEHGQETDAKPKNSIKFSVCGMSHDHIHGMIGAVQRGGGTLVAAWGGEEDKLATFKKRYPDVKIVATQDEIIKWQGLPERQARCHHPRGSCCDPQDHRRDKENLRHLVQ
jgi:hypothetical protein